MTTSDDCRDLYYDNLEGKFFMLGGHGLRNTEGDFYPILYFPDWCVDHLIGKGSNWHEDKKAAMMMMCHPDSRSWNVMGDYEHYTGVYLDCDLIVGSTKALFGFIWKEEFEAYIPVTCQWDNANDRISKIGLYHVDFIQEL